MQEEQLFHEALEQPEDRRASFLDAACGGDAGLRERVEALLRAHANPGSFLGSPACGVGAAQTIDQPITERPGAQVGPYKLLQQIGEGGMGMVYMAEQKEPVERRVALKIIKPGMDTRQVIARFEAERQALAMMDHPNIAKVFDAGTTGGNPKYEARNPKQGGNPKYEARNPKQIQSTKCKSQNLGDQEVSDIPDSNLEFVSDFGFRASNLPPPSDFGFRHSDFSPGRPYFVMELVKGVPITQYCDEHQLTPRQRLKLFVPVCQAVQHAHQKGIIHRDIKPSNVLVAEYDDQPVPKIIDFGVAKAIEQRLTEKSMFTQLGQVVGTIDYMSPEQAKLNQLDIDTRSDIYSLGVLLYELLTGETPLDRERLRSAAFDEMLRIIREEEPPKPSLRLSSSHSLPSIAANRQIEPKKLSTLVRGELDWIVMKALEKDRSRRYETANVFAHDIERYLSDEPVQACPPSVAYRFKKFVRRNKAAMVTASLVASLLVALTVGAFAFAAATYKEARQRGEVNQQINDALTEIERLRNALPRSTADDQNAWAALLQVSERASTLARNELANPDLVLRVADLEQLLKREKRDRQLLFELEQALERQAETNPLKSEYAVELGLPLYRQAFQTYGFVPGQTAVQEAAERLVQCKPTVQQAICGGLIEWSRLERLLSKDSPESTQRQEWCAAVIDQVDANPWRIRMRRAFRDGDDATLASMAQSVDAATQPPGVLRELGRHLLSTPKHRETGIGLLLRTQVEYPGDFWTNDYLGREYMQQGGSSLDKARRFLTAAVALRPDTACARLNLGNVCGEQGDFEAAIRHNRKALQSQPRFSSAHHNLGVALMNQGKLDEAIACFREAIRINPKHDSAHNGLGVALANQGRRDEAIACLRKSIELNPKWAEPHSNLGELLRRQAKLDEGIACHRKAVELDPKKAMFHTNLGVALAGQGNLEEAMACYRKAIELDGKFSLAHNNLAWHLATADDVKLRNAEEALELARKAVQLDPKPWFNWNTLSVAAYRAGDWKTSLDARQEKRQRRPINTQDRLFLAMTHWQLGNKAEARKSYEEAIVEIAKEKTPDAGLTKLRQEAEQLLGITPSRVPTDGGKPQRDKAKP